MEETWERDADSPGSAVTLGGRETEAGVMCIIPQVVFPKPPRKIYQPGETRSKVEGTEGGNPYLASSDCT